MQATVYVEHGIRRGISGQSISVRHFRAVLRRLRSITHTSFLVTLLTAITLACEEPAPTPSVVNDSAGVRITTSAPGMGVYAAVDSQPVLSLGGADIEGPEQFFNIHGVYIDPSDNIWIANRGSNDVRIFHPDGTHWRTTGRTGSGPGEFRGVRVLGPAGESSVAIWDDANPRLTLLTLDGELADVVSIQLDGTVPQALSVFPDGSLLLRKQREIAASAISPETVFRDTVALFRFDFGRDSLTEIGTALGAAWLWTGRIQVPIPFTTSPSYVIDSAGAVHVAAGDEFRIRVAKDGSIVEHYGVDRPPRKVTDGSFAQYSDFYTDNMGEGDVLDAYLSVLDNSSMPGTLPAYSQLLVSAEDNVWARIYSPDLLAAGDWDVYGPDRKLLGSARTPSGLIVNSIGGDRLAGVWRDESGVEFVRVYQITNRR